MDPRTPDPDATSHSVKIVDPLEVENQQLREEIALLKANLEKSESVLELNQVAYEQLKTGMLHISDKVTAAYRQIKDYRDMARVMRKYPEQAYALEPLMRLLEENFAADITDAMNFLRH